MARYIRNEAIGKPADFVDFIMRDFLQKYGFTLVNINGETVYQKGKGFFEMPQYFSYRYMNGVIHIEAWVKFAWLPGVYGKENDLTGVVGSIPKGAYKESIEELIRVLYQPLPGEQANPYGGYGQPMPNGYGQPMQGGMANNGMPNGYGQPMQGGMANNGMPNGYGQPMQGGMVNNGMQNGYGQPMQGGMPSNGMQNGMPNVYGQPMQGGPITVQGVDMKKRAKTGFVMSVVGIIFSLLPVALVLSLDMEFDMMVTTIWVCGLVYAALGTGYSYRGLSSSKRGLATAGFALGILGILASVFLLIFSWMTA